ncbi:MAG: LysE family translocator [Rhodobacteraceae bacterium]|nr:LysE family translocator [Paracoccaceae bacterium]
MSNLELALLVCGWMLAGGSPGPATLSIAGTAMGAGRRHALALAAGVATGSGIWGLIAAFGFGALMMREVWILEIVRYVGAAYLMWLAYKAAKAALTQSRAKLPKAWAGSVRAAYFRGAMIHLTNPKAILAWGALFSLVVAPGTPWTEMARVGLTCAVSGWAVFFLYAILFSTRPAAEAYARTRRGFDAVFAAFFGAASIGILTARLH